MLSQSSFSNRVPVRFGNELKVLMVFRSQNIIDEIEQSIDAINLIINQQNEINSRLAEYKEVEKKAAELEGYYSFIQDTLKDISVNDKIFSYINLTVQEHTVDKINGLINKNAHLPITLLVQNSSHLNSFMNIYEIYDISRIKRRIYRSLLESLSSYTLIESRLLIRNMLNKLFTLDLSMKVDIDNFINNNESKFSLDNNEWKFIIDLAKIFVHMEDLKYRLTKEFNDIITSLLNKTDLANLLEEVSELLNKSLSLRTKIESYLISEFRQHPNYSIPGFAYLCKHSKEYIDPANRTVFLYNLLRKNCRTRDKNIADSNLITMIAITNYINHIKTLTIHAANLYSSKNVKTGGLLYYLFHGNEGKKKVKEFIEYIDNDNLSPIAKLNFIPKFLGRQKKNAGLRANSFDTRFLSLLFNEGNHTALFGRIFRFQTINQELHTFEKPSVEQSNSLNIHGTFPDLLRGTNRFRKKHDRNVIREHTRHMFFNINDKLDIYLDRLSSLDAATQLENSIRNRI